MIGSKSIDLRKNSKTINAAIEGRGGGSVQMIQGRATGKKDIIEENIKNLQL
jgi:alanyl-tRNA synthetase